MAHDSYSNQDIHVEALFGDTNNVLICSRAHLKDYFYKCKEYEEDYGENSQELHSEALQDSSEDPDMTYKNEYEDDFELMKSMGLPTSFEKKHKRRTNNSDGYYSAYNYDNYEDDYQENARDYEYSSTDDFANESNVGNYDSAGNKTKMHSEDVSEWDDFWSLHGYDICLESWIKKYKDYIAPEVLDFFQNSDSKDLRVENCSEDFIICSSVESRTLKHDNSKLHAETDQNCDTSSTLYGKNITVNNCHDNSDNKTITPENFDNESREKDRNNSMVIDNQDDGNCDSALNNINDKFQSMNFSDEKKNKFVNDGEVTFCINEDETPAIEIGTLEDDVEFDFQNFDICSEVELPQNDLNSDILEETVAVLDFQPVGDLRSKSKLKLQKESSKTDNGIKDSISTEVLCDRDYELLKIKFPKLFSERATNNPLFICTKSEEDYIKSCAENQNPKTWLELWKEHCQEEQDKVSKLFNDGKSDIFKKYPKNPNSNIPKCKICGEFNCDICDSACKNSFLKCVDDSCNILPSNSYSKNYLDSFPNDILVYPMLHTSVSKEPSSNNISELANQSELKVKVEQYDDDEPPTELPIKRVHEVESEDEEPEDIIKDLGFVIRPTKALKIKKHKRRRYRKSHKYKKPYIPEEEQEDSKSLKEYEEINAEANTNKGMQFESCESSTNEIEELVPIENVKSEVSVSTENVENINENNGEASVKGNTKNVEHLESDEASTNGIEELTSVKTMELDEPSPMENVQLVNEEDESGANADSLLNNSVLNKYWYQRYRLFHRFDEGIKLDEESWFSVTPERIARHIAERCACGVIIDAFCGAGGNAIHFASMCFHVIAIDIDPKKIELAKHNATVYGVADYIDFVVGDYLELAPYLKGDGVFLSPPWGGPSYSKDAEYDIARMEPNIYKVFEVSRKISANIALYAPKNTIINQLVELSGDGNHVEVEQNLLNKKVKALTAYYGNFSRITDDNEEGHTEDYPD